MQLLLFLFQTSTIIIIIIIIIDIIIIIIIWNCHICVRLFLYFILTHDLFVIGLELLS
jgi:hypothetical protein